MSSQNVSKELNENLTELACACFHMEFVVLTNLQYLPCRMFFRGSRKKDQDVIELDGDQRLVSKEFIYQSLASVQKRTQVH